jgi:hypothetical protein
LFLHALVKRPVAEILADALFIGALCSMPLRLFHPEHWRELELAADMVDDPERYASVVIEKASRVSQRAKLEGEAAPVLLATAASDLSHVGLRKRPVAGQLFIHRVSRQQWLATPLSLARHEDQITTRAGVLDLVIRRH